jgi:hypothetical protein
MSHEGTVALGWTGGTRPAVRDSLGDLHVVYSKNWTYRESSNVYYSKSTDDGATWSQPIDISRDGYAVSVNAALALDSRDGLHCVWFQEFNVGGYMRYDYCYTTKVDSVWSTPVNISRMVSTSNAAEQSCIAVGPDDRVHVVFELWDSSSCGVWYTRPDGDSWLRPVRVSAPLRTSPQPALTASPDGKLHLCWREFRGDSADILYSCHDTSWSPPRVIATSPAWAGWPCLAAAPDGTVHLGFHGDDGNGTTDVYYMSLRDGEWTPPVNLSESRGRSSYSSAVAVDGNDVVYFCWSEETALYHYELMYRWLASDWSNTVALTSESLINSAVPRFIERAARQGPDLFWVGYDTTYGWCPIYQMKLSPVGQGVVEDTRLVQMNGNASAVPNPFSAGVEFGFCATTNPRVVRVYSATGVLVRHLVVQPGQVSVVWDGRCSNGLQAPVGVYTAVVSDGAGRGSLRVVRIR